MTTSVDTKTDSGVVDFVNTDVMKIQDYKAHIEKKYKFLTTDELQKIVNNYNAKSPIDRIWNLSPAEKTEYKVAVKILKERKENK